MFKLFCEVLCEVSNSLFTNSASYDTNESSDIYNTVYNYIRYESYDNIQYLLDNNMTLNRYKDLLWSDNKETMAKSIAEFCDSHNIMITSYRDR